ncbi:MAG: FG-GAP-like repeat-containing protein [Longimicrobiales bacterium]
MTTGQRFVWVMDGTSVRQGASLSSVPTRWTMDVSADFSGDGNADIVWTNRSTGLRYVWYMEGTSDVGGGTLGTVAPNWTIDAAGDFNGDGKADLVWTNGATGQRYVWYMDGVRNIGGADLGIVPLYWRIVGAADFTGDGKTDLLWANGNTGLRYVWHMDGSVNTGGVSLGTLGTQWEIVGSSDLTGDGWPDILWQNVNTGQRYVWFMNGAENTGGVDLGTVDPTWEMAAVGSARVPIDFIESDPAVATVGESYAFTPATRGGASTKSFRLTAGTLPPGLALEEATGRISGTPTTSGAFNIEITVASGGHEAAISATIRVLRARCAGSPIALGVGQHVVLDRTAAECMEFREGLYAAALVIPTDPSITPSGWTVPAEVDTTASRVVRVLYDGVLPHSEKRLDTTGGAGGVGPVGMAVDIDPAALLPPEGVSAGLDPAPTFSLGERVVLSGQAYTVVEVTEHFQFLEPDGALTADGRTRLALMAGLWEAEAVPGLRETFGVMPDGAGGGKTTVLLPIGNLFGGYASAGRLPTGEQIPIVGLYNRSLNGSATWWESSDWWIAHEATHLAQFQFADVSGPHHWVEGFASFVASYVTTGESLFTTEADSWWSRYDSESDRRVVYYLSEGRYRSVWGDIYQGGSTLWSHLVGQLFDEGVSPVESIRSLLTMPTEARYRVSETWSAALPSRPRSEIELLGDLALTPYADEWYRFTSQNGVVTRHVNEPRWSGYFARLVARLNNDPNYYPWPHAAVRTRSGHTGEMSVLLGDPDALVLELEVTEAPARVRLTDTPDRFGVVLMRMR